MIDLDRIRLLNDSTPAKGLYVLYWMQASQRSAFNPAMEYAVARANELRLPVVVGFGLMDDYPEANARHYAFLLNGLRDVKEGLARRGISLVVRRGAPAAVALDLARQASLVVCDRGYLRHQRLWREQLAAAAGPQVVQIEGDVVVPIETASNKQEFAARTLRPKINKYLEQFLRPIKMQKVERTSFKPSLKDQIDVSDPATALAKLKVDHSVGLSPILTGGEREANRLLRDFVTQRLPGYIEGRREPSVRRTSMLAAHLHFGQISPVEIALAVQNSTAPAIDREAFLEELIVRRELAMNFAYFQPHYDQFTGLPSWARQTLNDHSQDDRPYVYTRPELEEARTHDRYWNAAQREMLLSGYMHNMMRMYWGKKILEWKRTPEEAFADALYLNNKYFLCGRDPSSYANVGWLFGLHDRPWAKRKVFGTVRYMNAGGLERKFDMPAYLTMIEQMR